MNRMTVVSLSLCTLYLACACGCSPDDSENSTTNDGSNVSPDSSANAPLEGLAFDIVDLRTNVSCPANCAPATLLVTHVDEASMQIVWGATGNATKRSLTKVSDGWKLDNDFVLGTAEGPNHAMCATTTTLGPATFKFADHDDDGAIDLVISGHYEHVFCEDDYKSGSSGEATLLGKPHASVPVALGPADGFFPTRGIHIALTQPLKHDSTCVLVPDNGGASIPIGPLVKDGYVVGFASDYVLPLGASYEARVSGVSFTGAGETKALPVRTFKDFGVLVQDGFESGSMAGVSGGTIVESSILPAIEGDRMLLVKPGEPVMLRLRRTANEQKLVMKARVTNGCFPGRFQSVPLVIGVVGSDTVVHGQAVTLGDLEQFTFQGQPIEAGQVDDISLPLLGDGDDVLVYMLGDRYMGSGCALAGAIIDDVHLE